MIIVRNIIIFLLLATLAAIAIVGIMIEAPPILGWVPTRINSIGHSVVAVMRPGYGLMMLWWGILIFIAIASYLTFFKKKLKLEVQMEGGKVIILDNAIKKYIRNALSDLHDVNLKKIRLKSERSRIVSYLFADVRTRESLPVLERKIIDRVRKALTEDLGITNLGEVHVLVRNFDVSGRALQPAKTAATAVTTGAAVGTAAAVTDAIATGEVETPTPVEHPAEHPGEEILILSSPLETENVSADAHTFVVPEHGPESPIADDEPLYKLANYGRDEEDEARERQAAKTAHYAEMLKDADAAHPSLASAAAADEQPATTEEHEIVPPNPFAFPSDEEAVEDPETLDSEFASKTGNSDIPEINNFGAHNAENDKDKHTGEV